MYKFPFAATFVLLSLAKLVPAQSTVFGSDNIEELRLVDGPNRCQGRLEIRPDTSAEFGQACDNDVGSNEARVICRQLNCDPEGASVVSATKFRSESSINVFRAFGYACSSGEETSITSCRRTGSTCILGTDSNLVGIQCKAGLSAGAIAGIVIGVVVGIILLVVLVIVIVLVYMWSRRN